MTKRKIAFTAEQKDKKKAHFKALEEVVMKLPSTFGLITAERILAKMGVSMSQSNISMQIQNPKTYYHALMYLPAKRIKIASGSERCRDIQAFGQQKLIHYLFSGEASKEETENGQEVRVEIEASRLRMVEMGKAFISWEEVCQEKTKTLFDEFKERAKAWGRTVQVVIDELKVCLAKQTITLDESCYKDLSQYFSECCAGLSLTQEQELLYKAPIDVTRVEIAVICVMEAHGLKGSLSAEKLKSLRDDVKRLDKMLQDDFDGLDTFNKAQKAETDADIKQMEIFFRDFEKEVIHISQILFKYFNEYASDADLKVDISEALEFGVDEAVADDYRALQL